MVTENGPGWVACTGCGKDITHLAGTVYTCKDGRHFRADYGVVGEEVPPPDREPPDQGEDDGPLTFSQRCEVEARDNWRVR